MGLGLSLEALGGALPSRLTSTTCLLRSTRILSAAPVYYQRLMICMDLEPRALNWKKPWADIRASLVQIEEKLAATETAAQVEYLRGQMEICPRPGR
jgi:hypothetical protein